MSPRALRRFVRAVAWSGLLLLIPAVLGIVSIRDKEPREEPASAGGRGPTATARAPATSDRTRSPTADPIAEARRAASGPTDRPESRDEHEGGPIQPVVVGARPPVPPEVVTAAEREWIAAIPQGTNCIPKIDVMVRANRLEAAVLAMEKQRDPEKWLVVYGESLAQFDRHEPLLAYLELRAPEYFELILRGVERKLDLRDDLDTIARLSADLTVDRQQLVRIVEDESRAGTLRSSAAKRLFSTAPDRFLEEYVSMLLWDGVSSAHLDAFHPALVNVLLRESARRLWLQEYLAGEVARHGASAAIILNEADLCPVDLTIEFLLRIKSVSSPEIQQRFRIEERLENAYARREQLPKRERP